MKTFEERAQPFAKARAEFLLSPQQHTDSGMATSFVDEYRDQVRYVQSWKKWLAWDGRRWEIDASTKRTLGLARRFADSLWDCFPTITSEGDEKRIGEIFKFIRRCNSEKPLTGMLNLAAADARILVSHEQLNNDPMLLNVLNGTINLEDDSFRKHDPSDLITQVADVVYNPESHCPEWEKTFDHIFGDDNEMIRYVRQVFGYSLSGIQSEAILPIAFGKGCNGKSTVWNTVFDLLGDYATVGSETLLLGARDAHPTEKAALYQRRIVAVAEPPQNVRLKESRVKELTGSDAISCRRLYENEWTYRPTHTFWLSTNHLPRVTGTDEGIWRRIKLCWFNGKWNSAAGLKSNVATSCR